MISLTTLRQLPSVVGQPLTLPRRAPTLEPLPVYTQKQTNTVGLVALTM